MSCNRFSARWTAARSRTSDRNDAENSIRSSTMHANTLIPFGAIGYDIPMYRARDRSSQGMVAIPGLRCIELNVIRTELPQPPAPRRGPNGNRREND